MNKLRLSILVSILMFVEVGQIAAQEFTGRVTDKTGAVIPHALVTAHNVDSGVDIKTTSNGTGSYTIPYLKAGNYSITAEAKGFERALRNGIVLQVGEVSVVNFSLVVGSITQTITVTGDTMLDMGKADVGEVVENTRVAELPLNGRDPMMLADLTAGESDTQPFGYHRPFDDNAMNMSINGGGVGNIEMLLDGTPNNEAPVNLTSTSDSVSRTAYTTPVDSVQEFKMVSSPYDAQYGLMAGGVMDMILKSGTNVLHGDVYEYARRTWLDANTWKNDWAISQLKPGTNPASAGLETAKLTVDQYGFELDGPIIVPKIYNGSNKSFFTVQWEHLDMKAPLTDIESIPDPAWTGSDGQGGGNFSNLTYYNSGNNTYTPKQIYDPLTSTKVGSQWIRTQFPGNQIPANRLDPMAMAILKMYPKPNLTVSGRDQWSNNFALSTNGVDKYNNILLKWDENWSSKDRFSLRYGYWMRNTTYNGNGMPGPLETGEVPLVARAHTFSLEETHTFTPNLLLDFRANVNVRADMSRSGAAFDPTTIGWSASLVQQLGTGARSELPEICWGWYLACYFGNDYDNVGTNGNTVTIKNSMNLIPTVTWIKGTHTLHGGLDARFWQNGYQVVSGGVSFDIGSGWTYATANHSTWSTLDGNDFASFALGVMDGGGGAVGMFGQASEIYPQTYQSEHYWAPFIQDDWKITRKLTLNLGLRWDFVLSPVTRRDIGNYAFDTTSFNPVNNTTGLGAALGALGVGQLLGGETFLGVNGNPRTLYALRKTNIQPRFGFAYAWNSKTVFRGGFGESMRSPKFGAGVDGYSAGTGYSSSDLVKGQGESGVFPQMQNVLETPFATTGVNQPTGATLGLETKLGDSHGFVNPNYKTPSFWSYSLGFERQLLKDSSVNVSYVGSRLYNGDSSSNINLTQNLSLYASCNPENGGLEQNCGGVNSATGNLFHNYPNPFQWNSAFDSGSSLYYSQYINALDLARPMPQFGDITETQLNQARTWYNSLQVTALHRASKSLTLHGTWTYSKSMDAGGWTDQHYGIQARNIDSGDVTHSVTLSAVYMLPIGRGRLLLPRANRVVDAAIGGWELSGMSMLATGTPVTVTSYYLHNAKLAKYRQKDQGGTYIRFFAPCAERYVEQEYKDPTTGNYATTDTSPWVILPYNDSNTFLGSSNTTYDYNGGCPNGADFRDVPNYAPAVRTTYTGIRTAGNKSFDISFSKNFALYSNFKMQLRMDAFNVLNHPEWSGGPDTTTSDGTFGILNEQNGASNTPRVGQLSAKITW
jgi:hypothetical protein